LCPKDGRDGKGDDGESECGGGEVIPHDILLQNSGLLTS
jgi:hypothetical protein